MWKLSQNKGDKTKNDKSAIWNFRTLKEKEVLKKNNGGIELRKGGNSFGGQDIYAGA